MNEIQVDRWERLLRRIAGMRQSSVAPTFAPEVSPVFAVEPEDRVENEYLRDNRLWVARAAVGALAANYSCVTLRNISTTKLMVVEEINADTAVFISARGFPFGAAGTDSAPRDTRYRNTVSAGQIFTIQSAAAPLPLADWQEFATGKCRIGWVVAPGHEVTVHPLLVNTAIAVAFAYRERPFEVGEL